MYVVTVTETWSFPDDWVESDNVEIELQSLTQDVNSTTYDFQWEHLKDCE